MNEVVGGVSLFTGIVLVLVAVILAARSKLVVSGDVIIDVNGERQLTTGAGGKLLNVLADQGIFVSSACGGGGTCAQCKVKVFEGGGEILATETEHINRRAQKECTRLSCQVTASWLGSWTYIATSVARRRSSSACFSISEWVLSRVAR